METARAHGVGDKWGLFASHLPQRVGYQCSAYYRQAAPGGSQHSRARLAACWTLVQSRLRASEQACPACFHALPLTHSPPFACPPPTSFCRDVIIPMGLVIDKRFRMTRGGKAVYVG